MPSEEQLLELLTDLLDLRSPEFKKMHCKMGCCNIFPDLAEGLREFQDPIEKKRIDLVLDPPFSSVSDLCDRPRMCQVVHNPWPMPSKVIRDLGR